MGFLPAIIPISDLRQDAASVIKRVAASSEPVVITQRGRAAAVQQRTEAVVELLPEHPDAGRPIPECRELPHRELSAPPNRVFSRVVDDKVWIVAVRHARRRPGAPEAEPRG